MTREEAKTIGTGSIISISDSGIPNLTAYEVIIDKIYDDFESRTCENCIYWNGPKISLSTTLCTKLQAHTRSDFGCNKFERKG